MLANILAAARANHPALLKAGRSSLQVFLFIVLGIVVTMAVESKACVDANSSDSCTESYTVVDAFYFSMVTISTVGYGDLTPSSTGFRIFTVFYIFIGCTVIFVHLSELMSTPLKSYHRRVLALVDLFDHTAKSVDTTGDGKGDSDVCGRAQGLSGKGVDLSGDGQIDFVEPPSAAVFWTQELLPSVLLWLVVQLGSAAVFMACQPDLDFGTAMYRSGPITHGAAHSSRCARCPAVHHQDRCAVAVRQVPLLCDGEHRRLRRRVAAQPGGPAVGLGAHPRERVVARGADRDD